MIRSFLYTLVAVSLISAIFTQFTPFPIAQYLALSPWGILQGFIWQFLTYIFVVPGGISFFFVIYLLFVVYLLWMMGSTLLQRVGTKALVTFFFTVVLLSGIIALAVSFLTGGFMPLEGATPLLYAVLVSWACFHPDQQLLLFFVFPVKAKWLVTGLIAITVFSDAAGQNWVNLTGNLAGAGIGFAYTHLFWMREWQPRRPTREDQEFVERMLTKISLHGKESLTWRERWKMSRISKRRR